MPWKTKQKLRRAQAGVVDRLESRLLFAATWTQLTNPAPGSLGTMMLLTDGSVMTTLDGDSPGNDWGKLTPDSTGSYVNGTWTRLAQAINTRLFDASQVLQNGHVFVAGGEYGSGAANGETYDPLTNTWTAVTGSGFGSIIDAESVLLANGTVLISPVSPSPSGSTLIYTPSTNSFTLGPTLAHHGNTDEQSFVKLADDSIITPDNDNSTSQRYFPSTNQWLDAGAVPVHLFDSLTEQGPGVLLPDGRAFFLGATGHTAFFNPATNLWTAGPDIPKNPSTGATQGTDDAPAVMLRDGTVLCAIGPSGNYNGPTVFYLYNPVSNSFSAVSGAPTISGSPFNCRMLALPNGDALFTDGSSTIWQYDPGTSPLTAATPTITNITPNADGSVTLTGTGLNGINAGAAYGDDAQMDSNYPIVRMTSGNSVYYARSYNWSTTSVQTGSATETTNFTLPPRVPAGTYSVVELANGIASNALPLTISMTSNNAAPTVATAAAASPSTVTTTSTVLSVTGADDAGPSNLTYLWSTIASPSGSPLPSFSDNGDNAAKSVTATFHRAGNYTFLVTITDAGGLFVTSSVSVTVNQTLHSITVSPSFTSISAGQTSSYSATAYDQFSQVMVVQPTFTWTVSTGTGSITSAGLYNAPSTGTHDVVKAASGSVSGTANAYVVSSPWTSADVGSVGATGWAYDTSGTFNINGSGTDITGTADAFHFVYRTITGDGSITARVITDPSSPKSGVMFRNSLASNDAMAYISLYPSGSTTFGYRTASGGTAVNTATAGPSAPYWLRLVRTGNTFTAFQSSDGSTWTNQGSIAITMGATVYVGLEVCSRTSGLELSTFDNVNVTQVTVANPAAASPSPVTSGSTTNLSVLGADPAGESSLTYTWTSSSTPANLSQPTFADNGDNTAKNVVATFYTPGSFTFTVAITDPAGMSVTSSVTVSYDQTVTAMTINPANATVPGAGTQQYTVSATDQNSNPIYNPAVAWSVTGGGTINASSGLFTANQTPGTFTVTGISGSVTAMTNVSIVPTLFTGAAGGDTYAIRLDPSNTANEQIFVNTPETAAATYEIAIARLSTLTFNPTGGDGTLTVDFVNGNPIPTNGVTYTGGSNPTTGGNVLYILGQGASPGKGSGGGSSFSINGTQVVSGNLTQGTGTAAINYSNLQRIEFDLIGGNNYLNQVAQPSAPVTYNAGPGNNTLSISAGTFTIAGDPLNNSGNLSIYDYGQLTFPAGAADHGINPVHLNELYVGAGGTAIAQTPTAYTDRSVFVFSSLYTTGTGQFDVGGNDVLVHSSAISRGSDLSRIGGYAQTGFNAGQWNGAGIASLSAHNNSQHLTAIGELLNDDGSNPGGVGNPLIASFDNQTAVATDILLKYTFYGDASFDGHVDGTDYTQIDTGYGSHGTMTGWRYGDFDYSGTVDGSDYSLIDNAFNTQTAAPAAEPARVVSATVQTDSTIGVATTTQNAVDELKRRTHTFFARPVNLATAIFSMH
jgi:hypothetical protein